MQSTGFLAVPRPVMEENDCAVRALANATGMPYTEAHQLFHDAGRRPNKGTHWGALTSVYNRFGTLRPTQITLGAFLERSKVGTFIVRIPRHVFAIRDGVVLDTGMPGPSSAIRHYWEMREHKPISEFVPEAAQVVPNLYRPRAFSVADLLNKVKSVKVANTPS